MRRALSIFLAAAYFVIASLACSCAGAQTQAFVNPIIPHGADPSVVFAGGMYYSVSSGCHDKGGAAICIRASASLEGLGKSAPVTVWRAPACSFNGSVPDCADIWAPQLDYLDGKFYLYYAADSKLRQNDHLLFALVPTVPGKPLEPWVEAPTGAPHGALKTDWKADWGIDPDVFEASDHHDYLLYSCRQTNASSRAAQSQSICLAAMSDPLHLQPDPLTGKKVVELSVPTQPWETRTFPTEEGPFGFTHDGIDYILFSGSFSGTPDEYTEGILINNHPPQPDGKGNPLTNPAAWIKQGPIFDGHHAAYGTASSVLVPSPDGTELWHVYHGTDCLRNCFEPEGKSWPDRSDRVQRAGWSADGELVLGYPVDIQDTDGTGSIVGLRSPSTAGKGTSRVPAWGAAFGDAAEGDLSHGLTVGAWGSSGPNDIMSLGTDANQVDQKFLGANPNWQDYLVSTRVQLQATGTGDPHPAYGIYAAYVDHANYFTAILDVTTCARPGCLVTQAVVAGADKGAMSCPLPADFDPEKPNELAVEAVAGRFTVLVEGRELSGGCQGRQFNLMAGQTPTNGSNGQTGVLVRNTQAKYTNFRVTPGVALDSKKYDLVYAFRNRQTQMNLDNGGAKGAEGAAAVQSPPAASYPLPTAKSQLWTPREHGGGVFSIVSVLNGVCLEDPFGNATPSRALPQVQGTSTMVWQKKCNEGSGQKWRFRVSPQGGGFTIENEASQLVLEGFEQAQGNQLWLNTRAGSPAQVWQMVVQ